MKRLLAVLILVLCASPAAAEYRNYTYTLFGGSNVDSLEQVSAWIPVGGAKRVYIRTWTTKAAFHAATDADSTFSDSLTTFRVLLSDSICCVVTGFDGLSHASAADSIILPVTVAGDTAKAMAGVVPLPVNKELRAPSNGSGLISVVFPTRPGPGTAGQIDEAGIIAKKYLRVMATPLRRMTVTGGQSTAGKRVNGLKGLRMEAIVVTEVK